MRQSQRKLMVRPLSEDAFGLYSVVGNPRAVQPQDVKAACQNIVLDYEGKKPPVDVVSVVNFVLAGYFELAHRTGLYNRQREMWDCIARIAYCKVNVVRQGLLVPLKLPVIDIDFFNSKDEPLILVRLVKPQKRKDFDRRGQRYLLSFIQRINKLQTKKGSLTGAIICFPNPVAPSVIAKAESRTGSNDPINKYEARLPVPAGIPLNVAEVAYEEAKEVADSEEGEKTELRLVYKEEELLTVRLVHPQFPAKRGGAKSQD